VSPGWQLVPSQHPPLHARPPLQSSEQFPAALHASFGLQSSSLVQPQVPPARHALPFKPAQSVQLPPPVPHVVCLVPRRQVVPSQHPPLQGKPPAQDSEQLPPEHALYALQSACVSQPQVPPERHTLPFPAAQLLQRPPPDPHAEGALPPWQVAPSQQPPLHARPP
jgi:hypothetical protein